MTPESVSVKEGGEGHSKQVDCFGKMECLEVRSDRIQSVSITQRGESHSGAGTCPVFDSIIGGSCHKYHFCGDKSFAETNTFVTTSSCWS